jgi:hypothetical protein
MLSRKAGFRGQARAQPMGRRVTQTPLRVLCWWLFIQSILRQRLNDSNGPGLGLAQPPLPPGRHGPERGAPRDRQRWRAPPVEPLFCAPVTPSTPSCIIIPLAMLRANRTGVCENDCAAGGRPKASSSRWCGTSSTPTGARPALVGGGGGGAGGETVSSA